MLRYAERHSWTIYDEEQEPACPEALFACTKTIFEGGDVIFEDVSLIRYALSAQETISRTRSEESSE